MNQTSSDVMLKSSVPVKQKKRNEESFRPTKSNFCFYKYGLTHKYLVNYSEYDVYSTYLLRVYNLGENVITQLADVYSTYLLRVYNIIILPFFTFDDVYSTYLLRVYNNGRQQRNLFNDVYSTYLLRVYNTTLPIGERYDDVCSRYLLMVYNDELADLLKVKMYTVRIC